MVDDKEAARSSERESGGKTRGKPTGKALQVNENSEVRKQVDAVAMPIEQNYQSLIRQLRDRNAVGVVVAVNGRLIWADIFASTQLLQKYWAKLARSYATEAVITRAKAAEAERQKAEQQAAAQRAEDERRAHGAEREAGDEADSPPLLHAAPARERRTPDIEIIWTLGADRDRAPVTQRFGRATM